MSSNYNALCLSHDPAIVLDSDERTPDAALERARLSHPRCDLLIGRWSGALIEVCCPGMNIQPDGDGRPHPGWHRDPVWADAGLLAIGAVVVHCSENDVALENALRRLPMCWTPERLRRISGELRIGLAE